MPWRHTSVISERRAFVRAVQAGERRMSELCAVYNVSRKTGYKLCKRYREEGEAGLSDRSRAPRAHPNAVSAAMIERILGLRQCHPEWGPQKLLWWLEQREPQLVLPAVSTVARLLQRAELVKPRRSSRRSVPYATPFVRVDTPNALWSADFKGHFRVGEGYYCYPLTICDSYSRYLLECRALRRPSLAQVRPWFEHAFRTFGLPRAIRTDNGQPFASAAVASLTTLSVWWLKLGIFPERIAPGHPEQNARHERMHRTLKDCACLPRTDLAAPQGSFDRFCVEYNQERPHQALAGKTPATRYAASPRPYPARLTDFEYDPALAVKRVLPSGAIRWLGKRMYLSKLLAGERIAFLEINDGVWEIRFGPLGLAKIDARNPRIEPIPVHYHDAASRS